MNKNKSKKINPENDNKNINQNSNEIDIITGSEEVFYNTDSEDKNINSDSDGKNNNQLLDLKINKNKDKKEISKECNTDINLSNLPADPKDSKQLKIKTKIEKGRKKIKNVNNDLKDKIYAHENISENDIKIIPIVSDGNCFYRCISYFFHKQPRQPQRSKKNFY